MTSPINRAREVLGKSLTCAPLKADNLEECYGLPYDEARLIALAVNVLPALLDVLEKYAGSFRDQAGRCCLGNWNSYGRCHDETCPVGAALDALERELPPS